jgi:hypothetical protein
MTWHQKCSMSHSHRLCGRVTQKTAIAQNPLRSLLGNPLRYLLVVFGLD